MRQMGKNKNKEKQLFISQQQKLMAKAGKEIYENINQCLCLARLQLGNIDPENREKLFAVIGEANLLIAKAVKDLRNLAKQLSLPAKNLNTDFL